jgi:hypothetical protein
MADDLDDPGRSRPLDDRVAQGCQGHFGKQCDDVDPHGITLAAPKRIANPVRQLYAANSDRSGYRAKKIGVSGIFCLSVGEMLLGFRRRKTRRSD